MQPLWAYVACITFRPYGSNWPLYTLWALRPRRADWARWSLWAGRALWANWSCRTGDTHKTPGGSIKHDESTIYK